MVQSRRRIECSIPQKERGTHAQAGVPPLHHGRRLDGGGKGRPAALAVEFVQRGEQRFAGDHVHVDALGVPVPVLVVKGGLGGVLLGHLVLLGGQLFADDLLGRAPVVARVDGQAGKQVDLFLGDVAVAAGVFLQIILMICFGVVEINERSMLLML